VPPPFGAMVVRDALPALTRGFRSARLSRDDHDVPAPVNASVVASATAELDLVAFARFDAAEPFDEHERAAIVSDAIAGGPIDDHGVAVRALEHEGVTLSNQHTLARPRGQAVLQPATEAAKLTTRAIASSDVVILLCTWLDHPRRR
jgi:hypothetical protein